MPPVVSDHTVDSVVIDGAVHRRGATMVEFSRTGGAGAGVCGWALLVAGAEEASDRGAADGVSGREMPW